MQTLPFGEYVLVHTKRTINYLLLPALCLCQLLVVSRYLRISPPPSNLQRRLTHSKQPLLTIYCYVSDILEMDFLEHKLVEVFEGGIKLVECRDEDVCA